MSITTPSDWRGLRDVGRVVHLTLEALERHTRPGITTEALDLIAKEIFDANGARSAPAPSRTTVFAASATCCAGSRRAPKPHSWRRWRPRVRGIR